MNPKQNILLLYANYFNKFFLKHSVLTIILFFAITSSALSQNTVSGKITDSSGAGKASVSVVEKGTNNGTVTSGDGNFTFSVKNPNASLAISTIGYRTPGSAFKWQDLP